MSKLTHLSASSLLHPPERLFETVRAVIEPLGFELVHVEVLSHRQKLIRVFIDLPWPAAADGKSGVTLEHCARVSQALEEPLGLLREEFALEVSSPGAERPLRSERDYQRFVGHQARVFLFRPLTAEESEAPEYVRKNPKQKNFLGVIAGVREGKLLLAFSDGSGKDQGKAKKHQAKKKNPSCASWQGTIAIPLAVIAKAHLEPRFDFDVPVPVMQLSEEEPTEETHGGTGRR